LEQITSIHPSYNIGDIYLGIIEVILDSLNIAFIKLDNWKQNGFMVLKDEIFFTLKENSNIGEEIVVQICKEQISKKGPTVTRDICLENERFELYPYNKNNINIDKNFGSKDKEYLRVITKLAKPKYGYIKFKDSNNPINTWDIISCLQEVTEQALSIQRKIKSNKLSPCLISAKQDLTNNILKKNWIQKQTTIITKSRIEALTIKKQLIAKKTKRHKLCVEYCDNRTSNNYQNYIEHLIQNTLKPKTQLITGGHIVIEKTEALTSIDVNSGSFNKLKSSRETILWINLAATKEIINQLKLKNISGIIVIDFIGMAHQDDQLSLLEYLDTQIKININDSQIIQISEIGLVEITRQRREKNVYDTFAQRCSECKGIGYLREERKINNATINFLETSPIYG